MDCLTNLIWGKKLSPKQQERQIQILRCNLLGYAISYSCIDGTRLLLSHGADLNTVMDKNRNTILTKCAKYANLRSLAALSFEPINILHLNKYGDTALIRAVESGHLNNIQYLLEYATIHVTEAAKKEYLNTFRQNYTTNTYYQYKETALMVCCMYEDRSVAYSIAEILLQHGADVNVVNENGAGPLSIVDTNYDLIELLCRFGANVNYDHSTLSQQLGTQLAVAIQEGNVRKAEILLRNGADPNLCSSADKHPLYRMSPMAIAAMRNDIPALQLLLQYGANINHVDEDGHSLLYHIKPEKVSLTTLIFLIESGLDINHRNNTGTTVITDPLIVWSDDQFTLLLSYGGDTRDVTIATHSLAHTKLASQAKYIHASAIQKRLVNSSFSKERMVMELQFLFQHDIGLISFLNPLQVIVLREGLKIDSKAVIRILLQLISYTICHHRTMEDYSPSEAIDRHLKSDLMSLL